MSTESAAIPLTVGNRPAFREPRPSLRRSIPARHANQARTVTTRPVRVGSAWHVLNLHAVAAVAVIPCALAVVAAMAVLAVTLVRLTT